MGLLVFLAVWFAVSVATASAWAMFRAAQRRAAERQRALAGVTADDAVAPDDEDESG